MRTELGSSSLGNISRVETQVSDRGDAPEGERRERGNQEAPRAMAVLKPEENQAEI